MRWTVCSTPGCPELHQGSGKCPDCRSEAEKQRGTASQRGYGVAHKKTRRQLLPKAIGTACPLCGQPMLAGQPLDLDHTVPLAIDATAKGDRIVHATCNRARRT